MKFAVTNALEHLPQPWRNGGGSTRELLAWPALLDWQVRISLADIVQDGHFSAYPGVQRWFGVVRGAGVQLQFADRAVTQVCDSDALQFDGADAPFCRLRNGATQDLNLMLRGSGVAQGYMQQVNYGTAWRSAMPLRALFTTCAGVWRDESGERRLAAYDFFWTAEAPGETWEFVSDAPEHLPRFPLVGAWWLGAQVCEETQ